LFDDPYRYLDEAREKSEVLNPKFRAAARRAAARGCVLLENRDSLLPLDLTRVKRVAVIGPLASDTRSALGEWNLVGRVEDTISPLEGLRDNFEARGMEVVHAQGCPSWQTDSSKIQEAIDLAQSSDLVILVLGEPYDVTGESRNRTQLGLPGSQLELLQRVAATGTKTVTVLANGRPLTLGEVSAASPTLLLLWHAGVESGNALFDVIVGDTPIGGKLPMTFPRSVGQVPLYYNHKNSGRPPVEGQEKYRIAYHDSPLTPLYPFGYGLTTSTFELSKPVVVSPPKTWPIVIEGRLTNSGEREADEVPQLYLTDEVRSVTPPVKELKGFQRFTLAPGESVNYRFELSKEDLSFIGLDFERVFEAGWFAVAVGTDSRAEPTFRMRVDSTGLVGLSRPSSDSSEG